MFNHIIYKGKAKYNIIENLSILLLEKEFKFYI